MFDPSILPPLPPSILPPLPPSTLPPSILPPLPPMAKQPPWVPLGTKDCSQGFCSIYCPQWCYVLFPPPPPFFEDDAAAADNSSSSPTFSPLVIAVIGILASAFLLISYYTIITKFCGGSGCNFLRRRQQHQHRRRDDGLDDNDDEDAATRSRRRDEEWHWHVPPTAGLDEALIGKITVCRYKRGDGLVGCSDCSVCLGEFREDESLRLLPKCSHAFHVRCIDTWLKSHSNCPLCRANILLVAPADPPQPPTPPPPPEADRPEVGVRNVDEMAAAATRGSVGGTSLENGSGSSWKELNAIENGGGEDEIHGMRRSFSMDSFHRGRVSVADILRGDMEDGEVLVVGSREGHSLHCDSPALAMKRTLSSGRFCLTRQGRGRGRGRNSVLPI